MAAPPAEPVAAVHASLRRRDPRVWLAGAAVRRRAGANAQWWIRVARPGRVRQLDAGPAPEPVAAFVQGLRRPDPRLMLRRPRFAADLQPTMPDLAPRRHTTAGCPYQAPEPVAAFVQASAALAPAMLRPSRAGRRAWRPRPRPRHATAGCPHRRAGTGSRVGTRLRRPRGLRTGPAPSLLRRRTGGHAIPGQGAVCSRPVRTRRRFRPSLRRTESGTPPMRTRFTAALDLAPLQDSSLWRAPSGCPAPRKRSPWAVNPPNAPPNAPKQPTPSASWPTCSGSATHSRTRSAASIRRLCPNSGCPPRPIRSPLTFRRPPPRSPWPCR